MFDRQSLRLASHLSRQVRCLHTQPRIPSPTPFVPDAKTFLTLIGRGLSAHASKIPTWDALFTLTSEQLRDSGVEPARTRRYLLQWRERFRRGNMGVGGTLQHVVDGSADLRIVEAPMSKSSRATNGSRPTATLTTSPGMRKIVVNLARDQDVENLSADQLVPVRGYKIVDGRKITGPHVEAVAGTRGETVRVTVKEGMWEQKRGVKVDGGERRQAEVRWKKRLAENRAKRV